MTGYPSFQPARPLPAGPQFVEALPPRRDVVTTVITVLLIVVATALIGGVLLLAALGSSALLVAIAIAMAVLPLTMVWFVVWFIDRWEPEPPLLLLGALFWGGGIAVGGALAVGAFFSLFPLPEWWGPSVQAPIFEEFFKGLGVLVIYFIARRQFNGPTDGVVFGVLAGAGFAFTENILYFSSEAASNGAAALGFQFLVRGIALPLLHPICTTMTGVAIGWASRRGGAGTVIGAFFVGLVPAALIHTIWNTGATVAGSGAEPLLGLIALFTVVMVPIFIAWIVLVASLRSSDRRLLRERLSEYAAVGWYSPAEVQMLSSMSGRSGARAWAASLGPQAKQAMRRFIEDSSRLVHARQQLLHDPRDPRKQLYERELLSDLTRARRVLSESQRAGAARMAYLRPQPAPAQAPPQMLRPQYAPAPNYPPPGQHR